MTSIPIHFGTDPKQLRCEVDDPHAEFVVTDDAGEVARHRTTSLHAFFFAQRLAAEVARQSLPADDVKPVRDCELCGRRCQDGTYERWKVPGGRDASLHHACVIALVERVRRERETGQAELFMVGGGA